MPAITAATKNILDQTTMNNTYQVSETNSWHASDSGDLPMPANFVPSASDYVRLLPEITLTVLRHYHYDAGGCRQRQKKPTWR